MKRKRIVEVAGRRVKVPKLDKVLYPATGFTKGEVVRYYPAVAPALVHTWPADRSP